MLVAKGTTSLSDDSTSIIASLFGTATPVEIFVPVSVVTVLVAEAAALHVVLLGMGLVPLSTQWSTSLPVLILDVDVRNSSRPVKGSKMEDT